ncbi:MAG TPA: hypothetical protein VF939_06415 [Puia sp.]
MRFSYIPLIIMTIILPSCLSTARLSDLPKTAGEINFDAYAKGLTEKSGAVWTFKTSSEYYLETSIPVPQDTLIKMIQRAFILRKYIINSANPDGACITGSHGMTVNEWAYVTGVYYKLSPGKIQMYIRTKITQDITGGAKNNLSEKLGMIIASLIRQSSSQNI